MKTTLIPNDIAGIALAVLMALSFSISRAHADMRDDILENAKRCKSIADDRGWLDCYYGVAQPMRAKLGLAPAPQAQQKLSPPPPANTGLFARILGEAKDADVHANLVSYSFDSAGLFTVTLPNGQVWAQSSNDAVPAKWSRPAGSMSVTISPGAFGTFNLLVKGEGRAYKVKRVR